RGEQPEARVLAIASRFRGGRPAGARQLGDEGHQVEGGASDRGEDVGAMSALHVAAQDLHPRLERRRAGALVAAADEDVAALLARDARELLGGARLSDPGLAGEERDPAASGTRRRQRSGEARNDRLTADEEAGPGAARRSGRDGGKHGGGVVPRGRLDRVRDEAEAAAPDGRDRALPGAGVADRSARRLDGVAERVVTDVLAGPEGVEELVAPDDAMAEPDEVGEEVEDLRLDRERAAAAQELAAARVEDEVAERPDAGGAIRVRHGRRAMPGAAFPHEILK